MYAAITLRVCAFATRARARNLHNMVEIMGAHRLAYAHLHNDNAARACTAWVFYRV